MDDYIRKAVELADGLFFRDASAWYEIKQNYGEQAFLDALAAQLVRQVDERSDMSLYITPNSTQLYTRDYGIFKHEHKRVSAMRPAHDRTMNTLRVIVDMWTYHDDVVADIAREALAQEVCGDE